MSEPLEALPPGWEQKATKEGRVYFIDHNSRKTQWKRPTMASLAAAAAAGTPIPAPVAATSTASTPTGASAVSPTTSTTPNPNPVSATSGASTPASVNTASASASASPATANVSATTSTAANDIDRKAQEDQARRMRERDAATESARKKREAAEAEVTRLKEEENAAAEQKADDERRAKADEVKRKADAFAAQLRAEEEEQAAAVLAMRTEQERAAAAAALLLREQEAAAQAILDEEAATARAVEAERIRVLEEATALRLQQDQDELRRQEEMQALADMAENYDNANALPPTLSHLDADTANTIPLDAFDMTSAYSSPVQSQTQLQTSQDAFAAFATPGGSDAFAPSITATTSPVTANENPMQALGGNPMRSGSIGGRGGRGSRGAGRGNSMALQSVSASAATTPTAAAAAAVASFSPSSSSSSSSSSFSPSSPAGGTVVLPLMPTAASGSGNQSVTSTMSAQSNNSYSIPRATGAGGGQGREGDKGRKVEASPRQGLLNPTSSGSSISSQGSHRSVDAGAGSGAPAWYSSPTSVVEAHQQVREDFEQQIREIYEVYNPARIPDVPSIVQTFVGREQHLLDQLHIKYGGAISRAHVVSQERETREIPTASGAVLLGSVVGENDTNSGRFLPIRADAAPITGEDQHGDIIAAEASVYAFAHDAEYRAEDVVAAVPEEYGNNDFDGNGRGYDEEAVEFEPSVSARPSLLGGAVLADIHDMADIESAGSTTDSNSNSDAEDENTEEEAADNFPVAPQMSRTWSNSSISTLGTLATQMEAGQNFDDSISVSSLASSRRGSALIAQSSSSFSSSIVSRRSQSRSGSVSVSKSLNNNLPSNMMLNGRTTLGKDKGKHVFVNAFDKRMDQRPDTKAATKRQSIAMQQQSSGVKAAKLVDQTHFYLGCEELQVLSCQIIPVFLSETVRYTCLKCTKEFKPPFRFKYHCKCCGELYCGDCASHKFQLNLVPPETQRTPEIIKTYSKPCRICDYCLRHLSTGDLNSVLRYFGVIRDSGTADSIKVASLHALYKSIEYEDFKEARGMLRGNHLYPAFHLMIKQIGGFRGYWDVILSALSERSSPEVQDYACKITAATVQRISAYEDAEILFKSTIVQGLREPSAIQVILKAIVEGREHVCLSASYALYRICGAFPGNDDMLVPFYTTKEPLQNIFTAIVQCSDAVRGYLKQTLHVLLSNDHNGKVVDSIIDSGVLESFIRRIQDPASSPQLRTIIIGVISDISQSLTNTEHYERTVNHKFDLGLLQECSILLDWRKVLKSEEAGETPPTPQFLITTPEYAALSLMEILSESNVSHEAMISGDSTSVCCLVMNILHELCRDRFEESGSMNNESWQRIVSQALSFELNLLSCDDFNDMIPFQLCRSLLDSCLRLLQLCKHQFILHQCMAILSHFPFSSAFGEIIIQHKGISTHIVGIILNMFEMSCDVMKVESVTRSSHNLLEDAANEQNDDSPKYTASDMPNFHLLSSILYYSYTAHCISQPHSSILTAEEKCSLSEWKFEQIFDIVATNDYIWDLILHYIKQLAMLSTVGNGGASAAGGASIAEEIREVHEERCLPVLQFLNVLTSCKGKVASVSTFQKKFNNRDMLKELINLGKDPNSTVLIQDAALLCVGSACGAPAHFPWEEDLLVNIADRIEKCRVICQNKKNRIASPAPAAGSDELRIQFGLARNVGTEETFVSAYDKAVMIFSRLRVSFQDDLGGFISAAGSGSGSAGGAGAVNTERELQSIVNFHKGNCLNASRSLGTLLTESLGITKGPETCMAALRIIQCLLRDETCELGTKELVLRSKLEFTALLSTHLPAALFVLDVFSLLVKDPQYVTTLGRCGAAVGWALKLACQHASGSMLRVDPVGLRNALDITMALAAVKDCHLTVTNEMKSLLTDILLVDKTNFLLNEDINTETILRAALGIVCLLSDDSNVNVANTVQGFMGCLLQLIPNINSVILTDTILPEVRSIMTLERSREGSAARQDLQIATIYTLAISVRYLDTNMHYLLQSVRSLEGFNVIDVLFHVIEGIYKSADKALLVTECEIETMIRPRSRWSADNDSESIAFNTANSVEIRAQMQEGSLLHNALEALYLLSRAKLAAHENTASLVRAFGALVVQDHTSNLTAWKFNTGEPHDHCAYLVYRMIIKAWAYGSERMSELALTILARGLVGCVTTPIPLLKLEDAPQDAFETTLQSSPWKQLLLDQQVYLLFDIIDKFGAGLPPKKDSVMAAIDVRSVLRLKHLACEALHMLLERDEDPVIRPSIITAEPTPPPTPARSAGGASPVSDVPGLSSSSSSGNARVANTDSRGGIDTRAREALLYLCQNSMFMPCLESLLPNSLVCAKLIHLVFSFPAVNFNYSSPDFLMLLYRLVNAYFGSVAGEPKYAKRVPRIVLAILVSGVKHSLESARKIVATLSRDGMCVILKRLIDFQSHCFNDGELFALNFENGYHKELYIDTATSMDELIDGVTVLHAFFDEKNSDQAVVMRIGGGEQIEWDYSDTEKAATISLCFGILDMLAQEDHRYRERNDISHLKPSPRKAGAALLGAEGIEAISSTISYANRANTFSEAVEDSDENNGLDITDTFFTTDKDHEEEFELDIAPQFYSLWEALVTFTGLKYCTQGLLASPVLLDIIMSVLVLTIEGGRATKYNTPIKQNLPTVHVHEGDKASDHIVLTKYCAQVLANVAQHADNALAKYIMEGDKLGKSYTVSITAYISYVHKYRATLSHWVYHNECAEILLGVLHTMSCVRVTYCESIISSSLIFLTCLKEAASFACVDVHRHASAFIIRSKLQSRVAFSKSTSTTGSSPTRSAGGAETEVGVVTNVSAKSSGGIISLGKGLTRLETTLALLGNLCRTYKGGADVLVHTSELFASLSSVLRIAKCTALCRKYSTSSVNPLKKVIRLSMALGHLLSPVLHRIDMHIQAQAAETSTTIVNVAALATPNEFSHASSQQRIKSGRLSSSPRVITEETTPINSRQRNTSFQSVTSVSTDINMTDPASLTLWDKSPINLQDSRRILIISPILLKCALDVLTAPFGSCVDATVVNASLSIILELRGLRSCDSVVLNTSGDTLRAMLCTAIFLVGAIESRTSQIGNIAEATMSSKEATTLLGLLYKTMRIIGGIALIQGNPSSSAVTALGDKYTLSVLLKIFCGVRSNTGSVAIVESSYSYSTRSIEWLPTLMHVGELLQILMMDRHVQITILSLLESKYSSKYIMAVQLTLPDGSGRVNIPALTDIATSINLVLHPMMQPKLLK